MNNTDKSLNTKSNTLSSSRYIRRRLIIALVLLQAITVFIILLFSRLYSETALIDQAKQILHNAASEAVAHTGDFLEPAKRSASSSAALFSDGIINDADPADTEAYFLNLLQHNDEFSGVYISNIKGDFTFVSRHDDHFLTKIITHNDQQRSVALHERNSRLDITRSQVDDNDLFNPLERPWYQLAIKHKRLIWTEPYIFFSSKKPGITTAMPYYDTKGEIKGVIGIDIELTELSRFLGTLHIGDSGSAFLLNQSELVVAIPGKTYLGNEEKDQLKRIMHIEEIPEGSTRFAYRRLMSENQQQLPSSVYHLNYAFEGKKNIAVFLPFELSESRRWVIGTYAPENDFVHTLREGEYKSLLIACVVLLVSMLVGWILATRTWQPVADLRTKAITDQLTGIFNRHHLDEVADILFSNTHTTDQPLAIAMLDVDHFKKINDNYGHAVGDEVLVCVAKRLKSTLREMDVLARFGGEEFTMLLPNTDSQNAKTIFNRIREQIASQPFRTSIGLIDVTLSIGVSIATPTSSDLSTVMEQADTALYKAKQSGRNRVVIG